MKDGQLPPPGGWVSGRDSDKVVTIRFKNRDEPRTFYSRDWKNPSSSYDSEYGTKCLVRNVIQRHLSNSIEVFYSYNDAVNPKDRTLIEYYEYGVKRQLTAELLAALSN